ncbi:MAG: hypothetical protein AB8B78_13885 [Polaribacter sp.]
MKKKLVLLFFALLSFSVFSQKKTALDKVSKETCTYLESKEFAEIDKQLKTASLGIFIFKMYDKYKKQLNKEGIVLDLSKGKNGGREFGEKVGMNMVQFCPEALMLLAGDDDDEDETELEEIEFSVSGQLKSINGDDLSVISLKDDTGKTQKFIWLNNFEGSDRLINSEKTRDLEVTIFYKSVEIYSPKLKEYIVRKQVTKIEYLD